MAQNKKSNRRGRVEKVRLHKINDEITSSQVRIVGDGIESRIVSIREALNLAQEKGVDLVEISSAVNPVVCRLVDYGKFEYEEKLKKKAIQAKSKKSVLKTIGISPRISDHDMETKARQANKFLTENNKVRVELMFKGRENKYREQGNIALLRFAQMIQDSGKVESLPSMEGTKMFMMIVPKKKQ